jgi:hypothetical protein
MFASPLLIQTPGCLRVEAETEDGMLLGSKLVIRAMEGAPSGFAEPNGIEANTLPLKP